MKKKNPVFVWLWCVVGLFVLGVTLIFIAAFTTHTTDFSGTAKLQLSFETEDHRPTSMTITDEADQIVKPEADGSVVLRPKFESRETNIFDTFNGGPHPRTAVVSFFEAGRKRHEILFTYDRHGHVWQAEVSFPDPSIAAVEVVQSSFAFKGNEGGRRRYASALVAKALIGPPIIHNE